MPTNYTIQTVSGTEQITADRYAKDDRGDLLFFNGSYDTAPVADFVRENTVAVIPEGSA